MITIRIVNIGEIFSSIIKIVVVVIVTAANIYYLPGISLLVTSLYTIFHIIFITLRSNIIISYLRVENMEILTG